MNTSLFTAGLLCIVVGLVHSFLGERLIFRHLRKEGRWVDTGLAGLRTRQIRVLWGTWHLMTLFGWAIAAMLLFFAAKSADVRDVQPVVCEIIAITFGLATPFWLIATKGKHPAWIVFVLIAVTSWIGRSI